MERLFLSKLILCRRRPKLVSIKNQNCGSLIFLKAQRTCCNLKINDGIIKRFGKTSFVKDADYTDWKNRLLLFLETVPAELESLFLSKTVEYGNKVVAGHNNECKKENCLLDRSLRRRVAIAERLLIAINETAIYHN